LPIYASKDLVDWKHISHAWNRESQLPGYSYATKGQQEGMYAATIRFHEGVFYVICEYLGSGQLAGVLFKTTNPFDDESWSDPVRFEAGKIDPDLFWDDDGKVYVATQGIILQEMNIDTGAMGPIVELWNGTGGVWPEGPHIYKKDGWYYLLIAEGGTGTDHAVTMARARNITGKYEASPFNPHLTNRGTSEYFQTVGHADLFQDNNGAWWSVALATRLGQNGTSFPMGRETVLTPVTWEDGEWPVFQPVRGNMTGWRLPARSRNLPGNGPFNSDPDVYDFPSGSVIPRNLVYWRVPREGAFQTTRQGLQVALGRNNLAGSFNGSEPASKAINFIGRRQTDSTFEFSVDLSFDPKADGQEAGITAFLWQTANIQLGLVRNNGTTYLRYNSTEQQEKKMPVPASWRGKPMRLQITMPDPDTYVFSAILAHGRSKEISFGRASTVQVSPPGSFTGTLIGVYATCNGAGSGLDCPATTPKAYFRKWRYKGSEQYISETESVPSEHFNRGR
jgi:beta-xylosidase